MTVMTMRLHTYAVGGECHLPVEVILEASDRAGEVRVPCKRKDA